MSQPLEPYPAAGAFCDWSPKERATLREMREALDALPVKSLCSGSEREGQGAEARYCVLGALAQHRGEAVIERLIRAETDYYCEVLGTTERLTDAAYHINDDFEGDGRARWYYMRRWLSEQLPPKPKSKTARKKARKAAKKQQPVTHHCQPDPLVTAATQIQGQILAGIH